MAPLRRGDGTGLDGSGYSQVRKGDGTVLWNAIPDSALYHYPFKERSGPTVVEELENEDATANGSTNVSGTWWEGFAESGDGVDDYVATPNTLWTNYITQSGGQYWIAITVQASNLSSSGAFVGWDDPTPTPSEFWTHRFEPDGTILWALGGNNGESDTVQTTASYDDGSPHRVVFNRTGPTGNDMEIWVDGAEVSINVNSADGFDATFDSTVTEGPFFSAQNLDGSPNLPLAGILDNVILGDPGTSLSSAEIDDDYNAQPWS